MEAERKKAEEICNKFRDIIGFSGCTYECALIEVEDIIEQWEYVDTYLADLGGKLNPNLKFWYGVKKELRGLLE